MHRSFKVGVFDSGIGGLNVLSACIRLAPHLNYYYIGDNKHAPYGNKSCEEIYYRVSCAVELFKLIGIDAVVLGCNTATAVCVQRLREKYAFPIIGTEPAVAPAARSYRRPLVICTPRTAESARLKELIARFPNVSFTVAPMPKLAGEIERSLTCGKLPTIADHLPRGDYDCVILGCTHYAFVRSQIERFYRLPVFDGAEGTAKRLISLLDNKNIECKGRILGTIDHRYLDCKNKQKFAFLKGICLNNVTFLGESRDINEKIYKQMFALQ